MLKNLRKGLAWTLSRLLPARLITDKEFFPFWQERGYHIIRNHFYEPIPDTRTLPDSLWEKPSEMPGVEMHPERQLALLQNFAAKYAGEYAAFPEKPTGVPHQYFRDNGGFRTGDAEMLYCLIREHAPKRVFEIGSGNSTYCAAQAICKNREEGKGDTELVAFEPYPKEPLIKGFPGLAKLETTKVQDVPLSRFAELESGDFLFIDSSHVAAIGSDVLYEYLEIIPRLKSGVFVHAHDIFLPMQYPRDWVKNKYLFWNEQYLLQAFLCCNSCFEVVWAGAYMTHYHAPALKAAFPAFDPARHLPGSLWMRRV